MGTRADYYVGRGPDAEWIGSVAWDGNETDVDVLRSRSEAVYRANVDRFLGSRDDASRPADGWPWPWNDSGTTDVAFAFDDGAVRRTWGRVWFTETDAEGDPIEDDPTPVVWPDMSGQRRMARGVRSGTIMLTSDGVL